MELSTTSLVMVLTAAACILQSTCSVCPYNATGCECSENGVTCDGLQSMPTLYNGPDVISCIFLGFGEGNVTSIPNRSLPPGLESIEMHSNPITVIEDDAFVDSATTLEELYIISFKLRQLPSALLKLTSLKVLHISDTPIETMEDSVLQHIATNLTSLTLSNLSLSAWPSGMSYFRLLTSLYLDRNLLKVIPNNALISCKDTLQDLSLVSTGLTNVPKSLPSLLKLQLLDLSGNSFVDVDEFDSVFPVGSQLYRLNINSAGLSRILDFSNLTRLNELYLNNNKISDLTVDSLPPSLTKLYLAFNNLSWLPAELANMSRLSFLGLANNKLSSIDPWTIPTSVYVLDVSYNQITKINPADFPPNLSRLLLGFNQITEIQSEPFPTGLSWLELNHNQITQINTSSFPSNLSYLDLSYNQINDIVPDGFNSGLRRLYLNNNNLSSISNTTFENLRLLVDLYLSNNPISSIPDLAFTDLTSLTGLYLDSTNLTEIPTVLGDLPKLAQYPGEVSLKNIVSLYCPCPKPKKLANLYAYGRYIYGQCSDGSTIYEYFSTRCYIVTSPTAAETKPTTPSGGASVLTFSFLSVCGALFLLLSLHLLNSRVN